MRGYFKFFRIVEPEGLKIGGTVNFLPEWVADVEGWTSMKFMLWEKIKLCNMDPIEIAEEDIVCEAEVMLREKWLEI